MQADTAGSVELTSIDHGKHFESGNPIIRQKRSSKQQLKMIVAPILVIWSGLMLLFEVFTLGFRRDYTVYGSGIWVGLPSVGFSCLISASLGRHSRQAWTAGLTAAGSALLAVLVAGLAMAGFELHCAWLKLSQNELQRLSSRNSCDSCATLVMVKCSFQIVSYIAFAGLIVAVIRKVGCKLCAAKQAKNRKASQSSESKKGLFASGSRHGASEDGPRLLSQVPTSAHCQQAKRVQKLQPQTRQHLSSAEQWPQPQARQHLSSAEQWPQPQARQHLSSAEQWPQPQARQHLLSAEQRPQPQARRSRPNSSSSSSMHQRSSSGRPIPPRRQ